MLNWWPLTFFCAICIGVYFFVIFCHENSVFTSVSWFCSEPCLNVQPGWHSCFFHRPVYVGKWGTFLFSACRGIPFSLGTLPPLWPTQTSWTQSLSSLCSGRITLKPGWFSQNPSSAWREFLRVKPSLTMLCSPCPRGMPWRSSIWFDLHLLRILTDTSKNTFWRCMHSTIRCATKLSLAFHCVVICYPLPWCPRCLPSCLMAGAGHVQLFFNPFVNG